MSTSLVNSAGLVVPKPNVDAAKSPWDFRVSAGEVCSYIERHRALDLASHVRLRDDHVTTTYVGRYVRMLAQLRLAFTPESLGTQSAQLELYVSYVERHPELLTIVGHLIEDYGDDEKEEKIVRLTDYVSPDVSATRRNGEPLCVASGVTAKLIRLLERQAMKMACGYLDRCFPNSLVREDYR